MIYIYIYHIITIIYITMWSWNLLSWCGICSFSHTLQDQVTKSASCGMLMAHFPNHCLAHKSWPNTQVTRVQNALSIPSQRLPNCIVFCPSPKIGIEFSFTPHPAQGPAWHRSFGQDGSPARFTHLGAFISTRKEMTKFQGAALASEYLQSGFVRLEKPLVTEPF